jgi:ABC-type multidrug transport system ATPase subunit
VKAAGQLAPAAAPLKDPVRPAPAGGASPPVPVPPAPAALSMQGVTRSWRGAGAPVLDGLDLELEPGRCAFVVGRNGAGKTTLLRIAAGLLGAQSGTVSAFGLHPVRHRAGYQRAVSMLAAGDGGLYARLTVAGQLEFCARIALLGKTRIAPAVQREIARFELGALASRRVDRMSTGQRQRLRLAMTFLAEPRLVLLDEPLASLDADGARLLDAAMGELCAGGGSALWCSPKPEGHPGVPEGGRWLLRAGRLIAC